jgi:MFS family permease
MNPTAKLTWIAALAAFLYQFEGYGVIAALPSISHDLGLSPATAAWIPASYLIAAMIGLVLSGTLIQRFGFCPLFLLALGMLAGGALLCSASVHLVMLLPGRGIQGLGGGILAATAYTMIGSVAPSESRRRILGWLGAGAGLGMVLGAPAGGWIAETASWRSLFLVLVGLVVLAMPIFLNSPRRPPGINVQAGGWSGALLLGIGVGALSTAATLVNLDGWIAPSTLGGLAVAALSLALFTRHEARNPLPLFSATVWKNAPLWLSWAVLVTSLFALSGSTFLLPFHLQQDADLSPSMASLVLLVQAATYGVASFLQGPICRCLSPRMQAASGLLTALTGVTGFAMGAATLSLPTAMLAAIALGFGIGCALPAVNELCLSQLASDDRIAGSSVIPLGINFGSIAGVVVCGTAVRSLEKISPAFGPHGHAFQETFYLASGSLLAALILLQWLPVQQS